MNVVLWVLAGVLAVVFLGSGVLKVVRTKPQLASSGMGWVEDFPGSAVKLIGAVEIAGAAGLILPAALKIAPILTPLAAAGLVVVMAGAVVTHARRREIPNIAPSLVLLILAAVVAWGRFGPYSF